MPFPQNFAPAAWGWTVVAVLLAVWLGPAGPAAGQQPVSWEGYLEREKGLVKLGKSQTWVLPLEVRLRERWAELPKLKDRIEATQRYLDGRIEQNRQLWETQRPAVEKLREAMSGLSPSDPKRRQLEAQLEVLLVRAVEPAELAAARHVQAPLISLSNNRHALMLSAAWIRESIPQLTAQYEELAADPLVSQALRHLGGTHRLGPARSYADELSRLEEYERSVLTAWLPLYQQSGQWRFAGIVNEQVPVAFTWTTGDQPVVVTLSMVEAAGLTLPPEAPVSERIVGPRKLPVRQITIPSLRFGRYVLRDVGAWVLPPEGEDLGARIGPQIFSGYRVTPQPERLRIVLQPD